MEHVFNHGYHRRPVIWCGVALMGSPLIHMTESFSTTAGYTIQVSMRLNDHARTISYKAEMVLMSIEHELTAHHRRDYEV